MTTWVTYKNGNYFVDINLENGTKIRYNDLDFFEPSSIESMDCKITNRCYGVNGVMCPQCHENSTPDGKHGDILNVPFFDTLLPYTEVAIGGGCPLTHPDLIPFLEQLKERKLIANMTVNQSSFMKNLDLIQKLVNEELIYGLGVSLADANSRFIKAIKKFPNAVIHVINGIVTPLELEQLADNDLKILVLGYKQFRRGATMYEHQGEAIEKMKSSFYDLLPMIIDEGWFKVVSFDSLAIKQLDPKRLMSDEEWSEFYLGDDGQFTLYADLVNQEFAKSSTSTERWPLEDDIKTMFERVKGV